MTLRYLPPNLSLPTDLISTSPYRKRLMRTPLAYLALLLQQLIRFVRKKEISYICIFIVCYFFRLAVADAALQDTLKWLKDEGDVAIFDATNSTRYLYFQ